MNYAIDHIQSNLDTVNLKHMPLIKSCSAKARAKNIKELINSGRDRRQAVAISYSVCRKLKKKK